MTKRSFYATRPDNIGNFWIGERIPLKGCSFQVAHIEEGVLVLALAGFTKRGLEVIEELRVKMALQDSQEVKEDTLYT